MPEPHASASTPHPSSRLILSAAAAIGAYLLLDLAEDYLALPLREMSSRISWLLLNAVSFPVTRNGTILATEHFTFDVVPACSGSTTLRVLMTLGVLWSVVHPHLTWLRRLACIAMAVPIALLANGIRVSALVYLGDLFLQPVEGAPHALIGVLAFVFAMGCIFLLTELLSSQVHQDGLKLPTRKAILAVLLALLYAPLLSWCVNSYLTSPMDRQGLGFLFLAVLSVGLILYKRPVEPGSFGLAVLTFALSMAILLYATAVDVRIIRAWAFLGTLLGLAVLFRGWRFAAVCGPLLALAYLGFPTTTYQISVAVSKLGFPAWPALSLGLKVTLALILLVLTAILHSRLRPVSSVPVGSTTAVNWFLFLSVLALLGQWHFAVSGSANMPMSEMEMAYLQGDWAGQDNQISEDAARLIGRERITSRRYTRNNGVVDLIVTSTGGDRHSAHPPEYCMTGAGWKIKTRTTVMLSVGGAPVRMNHLVLQKSNQELQFVYWFSDGEETLSTHHEMLKEDMVRRLKGQQPNWFLFRIMTGQDLDTLKDFLKVFQPVYRPAPAFRPLNKLK